MPRNRIIYNVLNVYASQSGSSGIQVGTSTSNADSLEQLTRVQGFSEDFSRNFTNVTQYGTLAPIDRIETTSPTVKGNLSYFLTDGSNERYLGLYVNKSGTTYANLTSCLSGILTKNFDDRNIYLTIADEGNDSNGYTKSNTGVLALGNAFLTSYSVDAKVGDIPNASVGLEALNVRVYGSTTAATTGVGYTGYALPSVNPANGQPIAINASNYFSIPMGVTNDNTSQVTALAPGDVTYSLYGMTGVSISDLKVQSMKISLDLTRSALQKLGSKYSFSREINFPVMAKLDVEAELGDVVDFNLTDLLCQTGAVNDIVLSFKKPDCAGNGANALSYVFKGGKLISQKFDTSIGANAKFSANYEVPLGGIQDTARGIFISGSITY